MSSRLRWLVEVVVEIGIRGGGGLGKLIHILMSLEVNGRRFGYIHR